MSRWNWIKSRPQRLQNGSEEEIKKDIAYCIQRELIAPNSLDIKTWQARRREAELALSNRFGDEIPPSR